MSDRSRLRLAILRVLVLSLVLTLFSRLWYVQIMAGEEYRALAASNRLRTVVAPTPRGRLIDDVGRPLVRNRTAMVVTVNKSELDRQPDKGKAALARLGAELNRDPAELAARISPCGKGATKPCWNGSPLQPVPVAEDVAPTTAFKIQERREEFPGIDAGLRAVREYTSGSLGAHVLGYIGPVTEEEYRAHRDDGVQRIDLIGRSGLEQHYDTELRGHSGVTHLAVRRDESVEGVVDVSEPVPGNDIVLSIDAAVQQVTEDALEKGVLDTRKLADELSFFPATSGAAIVLEAKTGRVVSLASYPTFDPSQFIGGIAPHEYAALTATDSGYPLTSRATQGLFAPGSTFKIVSAATALTLGQANWVSNRYECSPFIQTADGRKFRNFEEADLGQISLTRALVESCDTVFYRWALDEYFSDQNRLEQEPKATDIEVLQKVAREFGFDSKTGIDLPSESKGRITDRAFKLSRWEANKKTYCRRMETGYPEVADEARRNYLHELAKENCIDGKRFVGGDVVNLSVGQGDNVVTPLQLAVAYAALANGGTVYAPRLAKAIVAPDGKVIREIAPAVKGRMSISPDVLDGLRIALGGVTQGDGTAARAFRDFPLDKVHVAGKTGTAQASYPKRDTSWFASFAPLADPEFVVVAMVEQGGTGASAAAPIVKSIYEGIYGLNGKTPALVNGKLPDRLPQLLPDGSVISPYGDPQPGPTPSGTVSTQAMPALPVSPSRRQL